MTHRWGVAVESEAHSGNEGSGRWRVMQALLRKFHFLYGNWELVKNSGQKVPGSTCAGETGHSGVGGFGFEVRKGTWRKQDGGGCCSGGET